MSDTEIGKYIAGGGVSGAVVAGMYLLYKCCYRKKFTSKCCGGEMIVGESESQMQLSVQVQPSPSLEARRTSLHVPEFVLEPATKITTERNESGDLDTRAKH
jgi:hypothetical protein